MSEKILLSACLSGENCRYDGKKNDNFNLLNLLSQLDLEYITVCPEVLGGLTVPRPSSQIKGGDGQDVLSGSAKVIDENGNDVTLNFLNGANKVLEVAKKNNIKKAILNERSPSCGVEFIYKKEVPILGMGVTTALLTENGITVISDEAFLKDN